MYENISNLDYMTQKRRIAKIFISSTFADMQMERDVLSRAVFPRLRAQFETQLSLHEIDLRWGVTVAMAANEGAIDICLDEIEICAPLVLGLCGSRIGWRPTVLSLRPERRTFLAVGAPLGNPSMTEIELRYAARLARDRKLPLPPVFFRSVAFTRRLNPDFDDGDEAEALRVRIKALGGPSYDYSDREVFEHQVERCLTDRLEGLLTLQSSASHPRRHMRISRPALDRAIAKAASHRLPTIITGQPGTGVSELARTWAESSSSQYVILDGRRTPASAMPEALRQKFGCEATTRVNIGEEADLHVRLSGAIAQAPARIRVVLDHFDEAFAVTALSDLSVLPQKLPRKVELVVTAADRRLWAQAEALSWHRLEVSPFRVGESRRFCREYLALFAKTLTASQIEVLISAPWADRVGAMVLACDELRRFGRFEELDARITVLSGCRDDRALARSIIEGLLTIEPEDWRGSLGECLAAIALSLRGLDETELRKAVGVQHRGAPLPSHVWSAFRIGLGRALVEREGRIDLAEGAVAGLLRDELPNNPERMRSAGAAIMASLPSQRRRMEEGPRIAFNIGGGRALAEFLSDSQNALSLFDIGQSFVEGWFGLLSPEQGSGVLSAWTDTARTPTMRSCAWPFGTLAARAGHVAKALELLEIDAAHQETRPERDVLLAFLTRRLTALEEIKTRIFEVLPAGDTASWVSMGVPVLLGAAAERRLTLLPHETQTLLRFVTQQTGLANAPALTQAELAVGQIDFISARWRQAADHFAAAEKLARRIANVQLLTRALERGAAVALERHKFRQSRHKALECRLLAHAAGLREYECLAFERLIEIERRRANWTEAYGLVQDYFGRCQALGLDDSRPKRMLESLEA